MVIKLYISGTSGNKEVKKKQQRVQMILDSKQISYEAIDITEPGKEKDKEFMQQNGKVRESLGKYPIPPQIFNDEDFCGDYEDFDMANEVDELEKFLHMVTNSKDVDSETKPNEDIFKDGNIGKKSSKNLSYNPFEYHTIKIKWDKVNGLQQEIIETPIPGEDSEVVEDVAKNEVNGGTEGVPGSGPYSDNIADPECSNEGVSCPVNEEKSPEEETETVEEKKEGINQDNDIVNSGDIEEADETKVDEEEIDKKEDEVENVKEDVTEEEEEKEEDKKESIDENLSSEKKESEKEEESNNDDSPQSVQENTQKE